MSRFRLFVDRDAGLGAGLDLGSANSPIAAAFFSSGFLFGIAIILGVFAFLNFVPLNHTDVWGHLKFGQRSVATGQLHANQAFTPYSDDSGQLIDYCWLAQSIFAVFFRIGASLASAGELNSLVGGAVALRFLHSLLVSGRLALLFVAFRRASRSTATAASGLAFIAVISLGSLGVLRPQVFGELLLAALLVPLSRAEISRRAVLLIPFIMVLWANCHGSYPIGLIVLGAYWVATTLTSAVQSHFQVAATVQDPQWRRLSAALVLAVAAIAVLNPNGYRIYLATLEMANHPNVLQMDEWQPLWAPNVALAAKIMLGVCLALVFGAAALAGRFPTVLTWLLLVVFAGQAVLHQRGLIWLFTIAPWLAMPYLGDAWVRLRPVSWVSVPTFRKTLLAGMFVVIAVLWSLPMQWLIGNKKPDVAKSLSDGTPWEQAFALAEPDAVPNSPLVQAIEKTFPDKRFSGTIYAGDTLGDFFVWKLPSPAPVFMYSHVHLFTPEHWQRFVTIRDGKNGWQKEMDDAKINLVVIRPVVEPGLYQKLRSNPAWQTITDEANLTAKRDPRHRLFVALRKQPLPQ